MFRVPFLSYPQLQSILFVIELLIEISLIHLKLILINLEQ